MRREMVVIAKEKYEDLMKRIEGKNVDNQTGGQEQTANKKEEHHRSVENNTDEIPTAASDVDKEEDMEFDSVDSNASHYRTIYVSSKTSRERKEQK